MKIHIRTTNVAFGDDPFSKGEELARILREVAKRCERDGQPKRGETWPVMDVNGNKVGTVRP